MSDFDYWEALKGGVPEPTVEEPKPEAEPYVPAAGRALDFLHRSARKVPGPVGNVAEAVPTFAETAPSWTEGEKTLAALQSGLLTGAAFGGSVPVAGAGVLGATVGELSDMDLAAQGGPESVGEALRPAMLDIGISSMAPAGAVRTARSVAPGGRAYKALGAADLGATSVHPFEEVQGAARRGYGAMKEARDKVWAGRPESTVRVSSEPIRDAVGDVLERTKMEKFARPSIAQDILGEIGSTVDADEVNAVLRATTSAARRAKAQPGEMAQMANIQQIKGGANQTLENLSAQGLDGAQQARALQEARGADAALHASVPPGSRAYRDVIGPDAYAQPSQAIRRIFVGANRDPLGDVKALKATFASLPLDEAEKATRELRQAAVMNLFGDSAAFAPQTARRAATNLGKNEDAYREALGDAGFEAVRQALQDVNTGSKRGRVIANVIHAANTFSPTAAGLGGLAAGAVSSDPSVIMGGAVTGNLLASLASRLGHNRVAEIALQAMTDRKLMQKLTRRYGIKEGEAFAGGLVRSLVRRGLIDPMTLEEWESNGN